LLEPLTKLTAIGVIWALVSGSAVALAGLLALTLLGMARDAVGSKRLRGTWPKASHLLLSPLKDLFLLPIWFDALVNRRISWRGHRFIVGRFTRVRSERVSRAARRRLRRVRKVRKLASEPRVEANGRERRLLRIRRRTRRPNDSGPTS
jgi:ceramide glucosyltransferase